MCLVMPPASFSATLDCRMASSRLVLPWSTWPINVTTGARGTSFAGSGATLLSSWSSRLGCGRISKLKSLAALVAVASSSCWTMVAKMPCCINCLMRSLAFTSIFAARSLTMTGNVNSSGVGGPVGTGGASTTGAGSGARSLDLGAGGAFGFGGTAAGFWGCCGIASTRWGFAAGTAGGGAGARLGCLASTGFFSAGLATAGLAASFAAAGLAAAGFFTGGLTASALRTRLTVSASSVLVAAFAETFSVLSLTSSSFEGNLSSLASSLTRIVRRRRFRFWFCRSLGFGLRFGRRFWSQGLLSGGQEFLRRLLTHTLDVAELLQCHGHNLFDRGDARLLEAGVPGRAAPGDATPG